MKLILLLIARAACATLAAAFWLLFLCMGWLYTLPYYELATLAAFVSIVPAVGFSLAFAHFDFELQYV